MAKKKRPATKTTRLAKSKKEPSKKILSFAVDDNNVGSPQSSSMHDLSDALRVGMGLQKAVKPVTIEKDVKGKYSRSKIVFGSSHVSTNPDNTLIKGYQRLSDSELRHVSLVDPYISAIIVTRVGQAGVCGQPSASKFDKGMRIREINPIRRDDFETEEEYNFECNRRESQMRAIQEWVLNCGTSDEDIINYAFRGADPTFKWCSLKDFIQAQVRNLLTFGRCGTQKFKNHEGVTVMFRPIPIETIAPVEHGESVHIGLAEETHPDSLKDNAEYNALDENERPAAWVQKINGQNVNFFTDDELDIWYYQKQALFDLQGYPLAPIEMAIYMTFIHQQTLGYLRNQFIKGMATRGIVVLESTDPSVQLSDADLEDFRQQFHNFVTRTDNSAVTPVIGGPVRASWVNLSNTPRDMEFLQVEEHVIRALCSAFQISPQEMGYGHLSLPQGGLTQSNKQEDIIRGEERGLRMVLDVIFEGINEIMYENFPEARKLYTIEYVGVGEDTRDAVLNRQQAELNTTATMSSLYSDSEKKETIPYGGDVPLAAAFHANVVRYMKYGIFMEKFFGEEGASKKPEYDFIIDPNLNQAYQQLKVQPVKMQQASAQMQLEAQAQQIQMMEQQQQMASDHHEMAQDEQAQQQEQAAQGRAPQEGQGGQSAPEEGQPMAQSETKRVPLLEKYKTLRAQEPLEKSIKSYFQEWISAHNENN